jgi:hypothetical protein
VEWADSLAFSDYPTIKSTPSTQSLSLHKTTARASSRISIGTTRPLPIAVRVAATMTEPTPAASSSGDANKEPSKNALKKAQKEKEKVRLA